MSLAYEAMIFACHAHRTQQRKYTGNPYSDHLAEVAGIVSAVAHDVAVADARYFDYPQEMTEIMLAVSWLHDVVEDQGVKIDDIALKFGVMVSAGVAALSDMEQGNRAERKAASRMRLAAAPGWVQTIKCADLISNTSSIVMHDPRFAVTYLEEKRLLLEVMERADPRLRALAMAQAGATA